MLASGLHRLSLVFAIVCVAGWFYVFNEWWGLLAALLLCVPVGFAFSLIPPAVVGTVRPLLGDVFTTWAFMAAGIALGIYALASFEKTAFVLVALCAAAVFFGGASLLYIRFNAMQRRATSGG
ncbi:MAG TPA: hypothetical protein VKA45_10430 [Gaiellaceae bacterium]|nr:hypothetical protein [Gaiellaceae bacterium]